MAGVAPQGVGWGVPHVRCSHVAHLVAECVKVMMGTRAPSLGCVSRYRVTRASMRQPTASRSTCFLVVLSSLCCGVVER